MNVISIWASRNTKKAILLIIIFEVLKLGIGFDIGQHFIPTLSPVFIELAVLSLVLLVTYVQNNYKHKAPVLSKEAHRQFRLRSTSIIFLSSLFLSMLLGNHFKGLGYNINSIVVANAAVTIPADSVQTPPSDDIKDKKQVKKHKFRLFSKKTTADDDPHSNKRIGYVLLFLLSLVLSYLGLYLSCGILCSGYGVLAALLFITTLGVLAGGIYFLIKAFSNPVRPNSLMTPQEKKKERKKFFIIWALVGVAAAALFIIGIL